MNMRVVVDMVKWIKRIGASKRHHMTLLSVLLVILMFGGSSTVYAQQSLGQTVEAEDVKLMEQYTTEGKLHFFVQAKLPVEDITYQIGSSRNHEVGWHTLCEAKEQRKTLVLIDNSLSVGRKHKERIQIVLCDLFANASDNETFMIAAFGETTEPMTEYTNMYQPLENAVLALEYYNRDTYLTDALYRVVQEWNEEASEESASSTSEGNAEPVYRRIVVISDGQELESMQHTREELYLLLSQNSYPIYTIGCVTGGNTSGTTNALGHMAALSRMTNAVSYTVTADGDLEGIVSQLLGERDLLHVTVIPERDLQDGSTQNSKLTLVSDVSETSILAEVRLPIRGDWENEIAESEAERKGVEDGGESETEEQENKDENENKLTGEEAKVNGVATRSDISVGDANSGDVVEKTESGIQANTETSKPLKALPVLTVIIGTFIVLAGCYFLYLWRQNGGGEQWDYEAENEQGRKEEQGFGRKEQENLRENQQENCDTTLLRSDEAKESGTRLLFSEYDTYEVRLTDQSNPAKFYSFPVSDSVIIGRSSQNSNIVIDYDESISGRHCELESRNGRFFVRDLRSLNGTRVNGMKVLSETEIFSGNILRLGQVEMKVGWNVFE